MNMKRMKTSILICMLAVLSLVSGCILPLERPGKNGFEKVLVIYSNGYNSLSPYLYSDILELQTGWIPEKNSDRALLLISHLSRSSSDFSTQTTPVLVRMYMDKRERLVMDTLSVYSSDMNLGDASSLGSILQEVKKDFPSEHYGMLLSSHASGWIPKGYFSYPERYDNAYNSANGSMSARRAAAAVNNMDGAVPYREEETSRRAIPVKSFSVTNRRDSSGKLLSYEMTCQELAEAIPFHLDYLLIDACLMGGIEVAYDLKDVTDMIVFSQAEVLAEGFNYETLTTHVLESDRNDVIAVADDYYQQYANKRDEYERSATISVVDTKKLDAVANACASIFSKYRTQIASLDPNEVQRFYRSYHHWYYDLRDIVVKCGASQSDIDALDRALRNCVVYSGATEYFLKGEGGFKVTSFSGFSMYLPCNGSRYLDDFYRTLAWNKATKLVE